MIKKKKMATFTRIYIPERAGRRRAALTRTMLEDLRVSAR